MLTASATAAIVAALANAQVRDTAFHTGDETTLLLFRPGAPRGFPAASAYAALRDQGIHHVATRTLSDGRIAVEFARRRTTIKGISALCHQSALLPVAALTAAGWAVA